MEPDSIISGALWWDKRQWAWTKIQGIPLKYKKFHFFCGDVTVWHACNTPKARKGLWLIHCLIHWNQGWQEWLAGMQHLRCRLCSLQEEKPVGESFKIICMLFWNLLCKYNKVERERTLHGTLAPKCNEGECILRNVPFSPYIPFWTMNWSLCEVTSL